jgi:S1-C subfamily serine protease
MDIKDLNKSQLILLAVLLSFITSIATGITTVTLMQQAPASFTTPVNNIIKQTIEKIQQVEGKTTVQTVVIKEEDLVVDAIAKNKSAIFIVTKEAVDAEFNTTEISAGRGFVISAEGMVVVDGGFVPDKGVYFVRNDSGKFKADFISINEAGFSLLKIGAPVDGKSKLVFTVPTFGDLDKMKIGQKIIVVGSSIASYIFECSDITISKASAGAAVLDLDGNILGLALSGEIPFVPINIITSALKSSSVDSKNGTMPAAPVLAPNSPVAP